MSNSSIWPINRTLSDATIPSQSGPGSNGNKEVPKAPALLEPIRLFNPISGHSLEEVLSLCKDAVGVLGVDTTITKRKKKEEEGDN